MLQAEELRAEKFKQFVQKASMVEPPYIFKLSHSIFTFCLHLNMLISLQSWEKPFPETTVPSFITFICSLYFLTLTLQETWLTSSPLKWFASYFLVTHPMETAYFWYHSTFLKYLVPLTALSFLKHALLSLANFSLHTTLLTTLSQPNFGGSFPSISYMLLRVLTSNYYIFLL